MAGEDEKGVPIVGDSKPDDVAKPKPGLKPISQECDYIIIPYFLYPGKRLKPVVPQGSILFPEGYLKMINSKKPASWDLLRLFRQPPYSYHFGYCELTEVWLQEMEYPAEMPKADRPPYPTDIKFKQSSKVFSLYEPIFGKKLRIGPHGIPEIMMVIPPPDRFCLPPPMQGCSQLT